MSKITDASMLAMRHAQQAESLRRRALAVEAEAGEETNPELRLAMLQESIELTNEATRHLREATAQAKIVQSEIRTKRVRINADRVMRRK